VAGSAVLLRPCKRARHHGQALHRRSGAWAKLGVVQSLSLYIGKIVTCDVCTIFLIDAEAQQLWTVEPTAADSRQSFALDEVHIGLRCA
jgi:hypothetical protein